VTIASWSPGVVGASDKEGEEIGSLTTEWGVEGTGRATKIKAICPRCHTTATFHDDLPESGRVFCLPFAHNGCHERVEPIPPEIQSLYLEHAAGS
jgi:hypothetical protein